MEIKCYGHSCFLITTDAGVKILTDPCDPSTGYNLHDIDADIVTVSHAHFDHNYIQAVCGTPAIVETAGEHRIGNVKITGFTTYHDNTSGSERGENIVFVIEADGIRYCHLGDLGHMPDDAFYHALGRIDILFTPVGGTFTIDAAQATAIMDRLHPRVSIPMHYHTPVLSFTVDDAAPFLALAGDRAVRTVIGAKVAFAKKLPSVDQIVVLGYEA